MISKKKNVYGKNKKRQRNIKKNQVLLSFNANFLIIHIYILRSTLIIIYVNKEDEESISANILGFRGDVLRSVREQQLRSARDIPLRPQSVGLFLYQTF